MFRHLIDWIVTFPPSWIVFVLVHGAALAWALRRDDMRPVLLVNVTLAAAILGYNAKAMTGAFGYDDFLMVPIAVALINLLCGGAALAGLRVPRAVIWTGFGFVFVATLSLAAFFYSLKFDRLI